MKKAVLIGAVVAAAVLYGMYRLVDLRTHARFSDTKPAQSQSGTVTPGPDAPAGF